MAKQRELIHREWFRTVSLGGRRSCPTCHCKLGQGEQIWSHGEYQHGKWRTVKHFCRQCWSEMHELLLKHKKGCGCIFELVGYGGVKLPDWLTLEEVVCSSQPGKDFLSRKVKIF